LVLTAVYCTALVLSVAAGGIPTEHDRILVWLIAGAAIVCVRRWRHVLEVVRDWLPFVVLIVLYDWLRGLAAVPPIVANVGPQVRFDDWLGGGVNPTVWLQHQLWSVRGIRWYDYAVMVVYTSHFLVPWLVAAALWIRARSRYWQYVRLMCGVTGLAYIGFALYPSMPPWMASYYGVIGHASRVVPWVWYFTGMHFASTLAESGRDFINITAALPSLHAMYPAVLVALAWGSSSGGRRWLIRGALILYTLAMGYALVYAGEHFVADVFVGWAVVALVFATDRLACRWVREIRAKPGRHREASVVGVTAGVPGQAHAPLVSFPEEVAGRGS
jgi:PAP2 superfamily